MTEKVTDSSYSVPAGQLHGVVEDTEHLGRYAANAPGTRSTVVVSNNESFIVTGSKIERHSNCS